ncbi:MAG: hypothetical protein HZA53_08800 [Planctomycetes bacterium]|nr:hypothetical protein [Planctomycetota bacterium]
MEHSFEFARAFRLSTYFGWMMCLAVLGALAIGAVLFALPRRRRPALLLVAGYALFCAAPIGIGYLGKISGEMNTERMVRALRNPTPEDRTKGYAESRDLLILGLCFAIPGALLVPIVWMRRRHDATAEA